MFAPEQIPVKHAVAKQFGVFVRPTRNHRWRLHFHPFRIRALTSSGGWQNKYFTSVPSASTPNHLFAQSATSCGIRSNVNCTSTPTGRPSPNPVLKMLAVSAHRHGVRLGVALLPDDDRTSLLHLQHSQQKVTALST